jgi:hypothetical protein
MATVTGIVLIVLSILIVLWGDKKVKTKEGKIVRAISMSGLNIKFVKWACGIVSFWFGIWLMIGT